MATTIRSTELDFERLKNGLKEFLKQKDEFKDYNFEASGLNNILDVLAYNTHYQALVANFALNESYLNTAQLRSSLVSIAEALGYIPRSRTASVAQVNLSVDLSALSNQPSSVELLKGTKFLGSFDDTEYLFTTQEDLIAFNNAGVYQFQTSEGSTDINIVEGTNKTRTFIVGSYEENETYVIPDENMDTSTVMVKVFPKNETEQFTKYSNISSASSLSATSTLFTLRESPNGFYEINFGDGNALGVLPNPGDRVVVEYVASNGEEANGVQVFTAQSQFEYNSVSYPLVISTVNVSGGGAEKESEESIRRNAPFRYSAQNRMVTANDYSSLILREYGSYIRDIVSWGGEENEFPEFGVTFVCILFNDDVPEATQQTIQSQIESLVEDFAVITFNVRFADPEETYLQLETTFVYDPSVSTTTLETTESLVRSAIASYTDTNINLFNGVYRRSNLLTEIDDVSAGVKNSATTATMYKRVDVFVTDTLNTFTIRFPTSIGTTLTSDTFVQNGNRVALSSTDGETVQVVNQTTGETVIDLVGQINRSTGTVQITGLDIDELTQGVPYLRIFTTPSNQSYIPAKQSNILIYDSERSRVQGSIE
jgi:hypothetical protein